MINISVMLAGASWALGAFLLISVMRPPWLGVIIGFALIFPISQLFVYLERNV